MFDSGDSARDSYRHLEVLDDNPELDAEPPRTRGECIDGPRPCPWVRCRHHLYLEVHPKSGAVRINFPDVEPDELERLPSTCSLDVASWGGSSLEEVGRTMNVTREAVRQTEVIAASRLTAKAIKNPELREYASNRDSTCRSRP